MIALTFDRTEDWNTSRGFKRSEVAIPTLGRGDESSVIVKVQYAGVCGSDKGIWYRTAFRDQILGSLETENRGMRVIGHEFCGTVIEKGKKVRGIKVGDFVSAESHVVCNACFQCKHDQKNVCTNEKILGISTDGCFAEQIKVPAHILWKTNGKKIRAEVAAVQEPFGNAVHAASKTSLKGKTILISGLGPIGLFLLLAAQGLGAKKIYGLDPKPESVAMAKKLGIDEIGIPREVDVAFEMAGSEESFNLCIEKTRRGGDVILFGIKNADFVIKDYNRLIVRGLTMHAVIGREIWRTWHTTKKLFETKSNGIQARIWDVILNRGKGTIIEAQDYSNELFEDRLNMNPKNLIKFS